MKFSATVSKSADECNIRKTVKSPSSISRTSNEENGLKELVGKLRSILPTASDNLSTLDVMQHAIYYIHDLNDILTNDKPVGADDEKENQHSFCPSDIFAISNVYNGEKQQAFNTTRQNGLHPTPVF